MMIQSAFQGKMQKRYKNKKDWDLYRGDKFVGMVMTDEKDSEKELQILKEWMSELRCTKAVLRWTATEHFECEKKEVIV